MKSLMITCLIFFNVSAFSITPKNLDQNIQINTQPNFVLAFDMLTKVENDVAKEIIATTSIIHRIERLLKIDKILNKSTGVPTGVLLGALGVTSGGLFLQSSGGTIIGTGAFATYVGEGSRITSFERALVQSGTKSDLVGNNVLTFGRKYYDGLAYIVDAVRQVKSINKSSTVSATFWIQYVVPFAREIITHTFDASIDITRFMYENLEKVYTPRLEKYFFKDRAQFLGGSSAIGSITSLYSYGSYLAWTQFKDLYDVNFIMSDAKVKQTLAFNAKLEESILSTVNLFTDVFSLSPQQSAALKETLQNDLFAHKIAEFRANIPNEDSDRDKILVLLNEHFTESYNLKDSQLETLNSKVQEAFPSFNYSKEAKKEILPFSALDSLQKILDQDQIVAFKAMEALYNNPKLYNAVKVLTNPSTTQTLEAIDRNIITLEAIQLAISEVQYLRGAIDEEDYQELMAYVKSLKLKITNRKNEVKLIKRLSLIQ